MKCDLEVNGTTVVLEVEPRELLVDVLRERVGLTGTKVGCDTGQCGSCVVILDGASVKSCQVLAVQASGGRVTTVEGVAESGVLTRLQEEMRRAGAVQCGFCTPGVVISLTELLQVTPTPTRSEVGDALVGNLCRCTGYASIVEAALSAAAAPEP